MAAVDQGDAGEIGGAKLLLQRQRMRRRRRCDITLAHIATKCSSARNMVFEMI
jgi:hypothetical protein